jgi:hypothetical protein
MHRQIKLPETRYGWWRFDRYQIQGAVIRPAAGSRLSWYDPWSDFQQIRNQTNGQPAYSELVRLVGTLKADPGTKRAYPVFSPESQSEIVSWCERHGLLGVLLSRWESVTLSPRPAGLDSRLKIHERYLRGYGVTVGVRQSKGDLPEVSSRVLIRPLHDLDLKEEALADTWYRFFPAVPERERETFSYPVPYSPTFWELYAEPVTEFWRAARLLAGIVGHLGLAAIPGARASEGSEALAREQAVEMLNLWRKDVSQVLLDEGEGLRQAWVSPSLLVSFAEMFVQDLVAGARGKYCECCGHWFISAAYQACYCSTACRLRQQKRNLRARMKQARASFVAGRTVPEISASLDEAPKIVQGWIAGLKRGRKAARS